MRPQLRRPLLAVAFALLLAGPAYALTIDNFESGDFVGTDPSGDTDASFFEQSGLASSDVVGGVRLVRLLTAGTNGLGSATLATTGGDDGVLLQTVSLTGIGPITSTLTADFIYDGIANGVFDGSGGALNLNLSGLDHFVFTLSSVQATGTSQITLFSSTGQQSSSLMALANGDNLVALSVFNTVNLADIQGIRLRIDGLQPQDTLSLDHFAVVIPEPGTALLLAAGLVGLAARRRAAR